MKALAYILALLLIATPALAEYEKITEQAQFTYQTVDATGSTISDAAQITGTVIMVYSVSAGQGVKLPPATMPGRMVFLYNFGANNLSLYPPDGSSAIGTGGAGAAVTVSVGTFVTCANITTAVWVCGEASAA